MIGSAIDRTARLPAGLLIDGEWVHRTASGFMEHVDPATGHTQSFPAGGQAEAEAAVAAALRARKVFRAWSPVQRRDVLQRIAAGLRARAGDFAVVGTRETGQLQALAGAYPMWAAEWFDYYAGWADKIEGQTVSGAPGFDYTVPEPVGVVAILLTWNGPIGSIGMKVAAALAAGCTVVLKPPELAPFSATLFGQVCEEAGLPAGVLNIVTGGPELGDALVRHPDVDKINFTGGLAVARQIQKACADSLTPLVLELGGKSANIVFPDADLAAAARHAAAGVTRLAGQICVAPTRLLVHEDVYDTVVGGLLDELRSARIGDPFDPATTMGPMISERASARVVDAVADSVANGSGTLLTGGTRLEGAHASGCYVSPAVIADVDPKSPIARDEVFGPVLTVFRFRTDDEAIELANDSPLGLAAYVHTRDLLRAHRTAAELDAGNVGINGGSATAGPYAPFGGFKDSGYGKEGGQAGLLEYVRMKNVNISTDVAG